VAASISELGSIESYLWLVDLKVLVLDLDEELMVSKVGLENGFFSLC
jgi:hypothetical protein